jgi:hypothetical protein
LFFLFLLNSESGFMFRHLVQDLLITPDTSTCSIIYLRGNLTKYQIMRLMDYWLEEGGGGPFPIREVAIWETPAAGIPAATAAAAAAAATEAEAVAVAAVAALLAVVMEVALLAAAIVSCTLPLQKIAETTEPITPKQLKAATKMEGFQ